MTHTLEAFVDRLRSDGVAAGREAAERIRRDAEEQAEQLLRDAREHAQQIVASAETERKQTIARTHSELQIAARDTVAKLREALSQAVMVVLSRAVGEKLEDSDFLAELIRDVVNQYARVDAAGEGTITVHVSESMRQRLARWAIATFHQGTENRRLSFVLHASLTGAGFEYQLSDGTVEITPESVVQILAEIVTPELHKLIASAIGGGDVAEGRTATR